MIDVSRETQERLKAFEATLLKWNARINLISPASVSEFWQRHIVDSLQLWPLIAEKTSWIDLGSGGGLPGLVVAIAAKSEGSACQFTLVESDHRKSAFLRSVIRDQQLQAVVKSARIESLDPLGGDIVSARALAPLDTLLGFAHHHLAENGTALFPKGKNWQKELETAKQRWDMKVNAIPSKTESGAAILKIEGLKRV